MKKILSTFLAAVIVMTALLSFPLTTSAVITAEYEATNLFVAPTIATNSTYTTKWLGLDSNCDSSISYDVNNASNNSIRPLRFKGNKPILTTPILAENVSGGTANVTDTSVKNFNWEFVEASSGNTNNRAVYGYFFHVDTARAEYASDYNEILNYNGAGGTAAGLENIHNVFAVVYAQNDTTDGLKGKAFTVLQPAYDENGVSLGLRPIKYTEEDGVITPDESAYLAIGQIANQTFRKITIILEENLLTLVFEQTTAATGSTSVDSATNMSDDAKYSKKNFVVSNEALEKAPAGDFAISATPKSDQSATAVHYYSANMVIDELSLAEDYYDNNPVFDSSLTDEVWLEATNSAYEITKQEDGSLHVPGYTVTKSILKNSGYNNTVLGDFVWEFEYKPDDSASSQVTFLFHVDEDRATYKSVLPTATGSQRGNVRNAMAITIYGSNPAYGSNVKTDKNQTDLEAYYYYDNDGVPTKVNSDTFSNTVRADIATNASGGAYTPAQKYNVYFNEKGEIVTKTDDIKAVKAAINDEDDSTIGYVIRKPSSYTEIKSVDADGMKADTYYTVRLMMSGNTLTTAIWETGKKAETLSQFVCIYDNTQMSYAPSGDFAILAGNKDSSYSVKNMKMYKGTDLFTASDYSAYEDYLTKYTFDESEEDLEFLISDTPKHDTTEGKYDNTNKNIALNAGENDFVRIQNFDGGNGNLKDFILKWQATDNHNWLNSTMYFRRTSGSSYYSVNIHEYGGNSAENSSYYAYKYSVLTLNKYTAEGNQILASVPVGIGMLANRAAQFKVQMVGGNIKVWFGEVGADYIEPLIDYTDSDPLEKGYLYYEHKKGTLKMDDIYIYDLTAKAFADDVDAAADGLTRAEGRALEVDYQALHKAQKAKLEATIADYNDSVVAAIAANEFNAMKANDDEAVDICDLVALDLAVDAAGTLAADPEFDGVTDGKDLTALRKFLLGIKHY
ncbi:MAG: hypothetical protein J6B93_04305 [Clostridia bacterium]|nr:hypothetical protein [Clostridia bacterium]